jgi:hypothetical protein
VAGLHGRLGQAEHSGDLLGGQLLGVAEHEHLAVRGRQAGESRLDPGAQFGADDTLHRAAARGDQPLGEFQGRLGGQVGRLFAGDVTLPGRVPAVELDQPFPRELPQPGVERQRPVPQVAVELAGRVGQRLLDHVGRVHARRQPAVEPQGDHAAEPVAVPGEQAVAGRGIAGGRPVEQFVGVRGRGHGGSR